MSKNSELLEPDDMHGPIGRDELITLYFGSRRMISDLVKSNLILASENVHLRAENEELNAWKSGMKGVEEFYSMRYQRDEWRELCRQYDELFYDSASVSAVDQVRADFHKLNEKLRHGGE